jgi:L,D-peptidoglycan transpeptidase YkuD (ErfK/YbiS/YcfS/YnhG family)
MKSPIYRFILIALLMQCSMGNLLAKTAKMPPHNDVTDLPGKQLLIVVADGWDNLQGTLYGFKKRHHKWVLQFSNPVVLGRKGLGMGDGMVPMVIDGAPVKKEGDLKSPAGIFSIGTAFGYADHKQARWIKNPYVKATDTLICVDDMRSAYYNTLVHIDATKNDWKSHEEMRRPDVYYKWGLFVNHNAINPKPGDGSCIFLHIWENDHQGTTGCTAMQEADILRILHWIKARKKPMLVQLPKEEYNKYREQYHLPQIDFK